MTRGTKVILTLFNVVAIGVVFNLILMSSATVNVSILSDYVTVIGVFIAFGALIFTAMEYFYKKKRDEAENRPYVIVTIEPSEYAFTMFDVIIQNYGKTAAKDISIQFSPDQLLPPYRTKVSELKLLNNYKFLPPGRRFRFFFGQYTNTQDMLSDESIKKEYVIKVKYSDVVGKGYSDEFYADPRDYGPLSGLSGLKTVGDVVKSLDKISTVIAKENT